MKSDSACSPPVRQLLSLVKSALWQTPADAQPFTDYAADWKSIGNLAMVQTVGALAVKGAMTLPPALRPPKEWLHKGYALIELNRRTHNLLDSCVAEAFTFLSDAGLNPVLLKGQAYARAYPDTILRQCGDIDIYVGAESYRKAYEASLLAGWESVGKFTPTEKHYGCTLRGVKIELHRAAAQLMSPSADRRFRKWSAGELIAGRHSLSIGGEDVAVPTPLFDVVFVFMHLFRHFITSGVGLRHLCDWTMILHAHSHEIDREELARLLKDFGMLKAWRLFTPIAVDHLGLPPDECPLYSPRCRHKADMILTFIIREGNFGRGISPASGRPKGYFRGKAFSFLHKSSRLYSKFRIYPRYVLRHHLEFIRIGFRTVLYDFSGR